MSEVKIQSGESTLEVITGYGRVRLDIGRTPSEADIQIVHEIMNLGARIYADKIWAARLAVDNLIDWRLS